jgi:endonuclease-3
MGLCERLVNVYDGKLPSAREDLESLPGVGRKSANVILNAVFGEASMPVDTHLLRIAPRIGLSDGTVPRKVEDDLMKKIPARYLDKAHHWLVLHGRYVCKARNPLCEECLINDLCRRNGVADKKSEDCCDSAKA